MANMQYENMPATDGLLLADYNFSEELQQDIFASSEWYDSEMSGEGDDLYIFQQGFLDITAAGAGFSVQISDDDSVDGLGWLTSADILQEDVTCGDPYDQGRCLVELSDNDPTDSSNEPDDSESGVLSSDSSHVSSPDDSEVEEIALETFKLSCNQQRKGFGKRSQPKKRVTRKNCAVEKRPRIQNDRNVPRNRKKLVIQQAHMSLDGEDVQLWWNRRARQWEAKDSELRGMSCDFLKDLIPRADADDGGDAIVHTIWVRMNGLPTQFWWKRDCWEGANYKGQRICLQAETVWELIDQSGNSIEHPVYR